MGFDYVCGIQRVNDELNEIILRCYPRALSWHKEYYSDSDNYSRKQIVDAYFVRKEEVAAYGMKYRMLKELSVNCYWHADDDWEDLKKSMTQEDIEFYGNMIVQQAVLLGDKIISDPSHPWYGDHASEYIIEQYDNGRFREFIGDEILKKAVNQTFNKIMAKNTDFRWKGDAHVEHLSLVMKYSNLLDPNKIDMDCNPKREIYGENYIRFFESIQENLPYEKASRLVAPIMNHIISELEAYKSSYSKSSSMVRLENELGGYKYYMDSPCMKKILRSRLENSADGIRMGGSDARGNVRVTEFLASLSGISESALAEIISQKISSDPDYILESGIPLGWIKSEKLRAIRDNLFSEVGSNRDKRRQKEIVPDLSKIQKAMDVGLMDRATGIDIIVRDLEKYVSEKRKRSRDATAQLLNSLRQESVSPSLFESVVEKAKKSIGEERKEPKSDEMKVEYTGGKPLHFNEPQKTSQFGLWDF